MKFKEKKLLKEFAKCDPFLQKLCLEFDTKSEELGVEAICTRILDTVKGATGVHQAGRAADFRDQHAGEMLYGPAARAALLRHFNDNYKRMDGRPTLLWHSFQGGPWHFHLQVPADKRVLIGGGGAELDS